MIMHMAKRIVRWIIVSCSLHSWWAAPRRGVGGWCVAAVVSVAAPRGGVGGLLRASPPSFRWSAARRGVGGVSLAASISMGYTSPGCRRAMPRLTSPGWPNVATHRVRVAAALLFGAGAGGGRVGSGWGHLWSLRWGPKVAI